MYFNMAVTMTRSDLIQLIFSAAPQQMAREREQLMIMIWFLMFGAIIMNVQLPT